MMSYSKKIKNKMPLLQIYSPPRMSLKKFIEINLKLRVELIALISSGNQNIAYLINWLKKLLIASFYMISYRDL